MDDWGSEEIAACADIIQYLRKRHRQPCSIKNLSDYYPDYQVEDFDKLIEDMVGCDSVPVKYCDSKKEMVTLTSSPEEAQSFYEDLRSEIY